MNAKKVYGCRIYIDKLAKDMILYGCRGTVAFRVTAGLMNFTGGARPSYSSIIISGRWAASDTGRTASKICSKEARSVWLSVSLLNIDLWVRMRAELVLLTTSAEASEMKKSRLSLSCYVYSQLFAKEKEVLRYLLHEWSGRTVYIGSLHCFVSSSECFRD